jgi:hypothetical protein
MASSAADPLRHAMRLDALEQQLRPCLPPALAEHCRLANITGDRLVFVVDSPVWNARLRLASAELVEVARSLGLGVNSVTARTSLQPLFPTAPAGSPAQAPSPTAREALRMALAMLEDSPTAETSAVKQDPGTGSKR